MQQLQFGLTNQAIDLHNTAVSKKKQACLGIAMFTCELKGSFEMMTKKKKKIRRKIIIRIIIRRREEEEYTVKIGKAEYRKFLDENHETLS